MARLVCPLCRATVVDGAEPEPGVCPGCGAEFGGGAASPLEAAEIVLRARGVGGDAAAYVERLFRSDPTDPAVSDAIASDEREGFYLWWIFRR